MIRNAFLWLVENVTFIVCLIVLIPYYTVREFL